MSNFSTQDKRFGEFIKLLRNYIGNDAPVEKYLCDFISLVTIENNELLEKVKENDGVKLWFNLSRKYPKWLLRGLFQNLDTSDLPGKLEDLSETAQVRLCEEVNRVFNKNLSFDKNNFTATIAELYEELLGEALGTIGYSNCTSSMIRQTKTRVEEEKQEKIEYSKKAIVSNERRFNTFKESKLFFDIDINYLKNMIEAGHVLSKIFFNSITGRSNEKNFIKLKKILNNDELKSCYKNFDNIMNELIVAYLQNDHLRLSIILVGFFESVQLYTIKNFGKQDINIYNEKLINDYFIYVSKDVVKNQMEFYNFLDSLVSMNEKKRIEKMAEYLHVYSGKYSLDKIAMEARKLLTKFLQRSETIEQLKEKIKLFKDYASDEFSSVVGEVMIKEVNSTKEEKFNDFRKTNIWPISIWINNDDFEEKCMDLIEKVARTSKNREECVSKMWEIYEAYIDWKNEKLLQVIVRVLYEFQIATDEEFDKLKELL